MATPAAMYHTIPSTMASRFEDACNTARHHLTPTNASAAGMRVGFSAQIAATCNPMSAARGKRDVLSSLSSKMRNSDMKNAVGMSTAVMLTSGGGIARNTKMTDAAANVVRPSRAM